MRGGGTIENIVINDKKFVIIKTTLSDLFYHSNSKQIVWAMYEEDHNIANNYLGFESTLKNAREWIYSIAKRLARKG